jgi:hypothetical protein
MRCCATADTCIGFLLFTAFTLAAGSALAPFEPNSCPIACGGGRCSAQALLKPKSVAENDQTQCPSQRNETGFYRGWGCNAGLYLQTVVLAVSDAPVWLSTYLRNANSLDVAFAGFDLNVLRFESYIVAQTFYVVAFVIPDTLPSVLLLTLILLSLRTRSASGEKDTPLLTDDTDESEVPMQYAE